MRLGKVITPVFLAFLFLFGQVGLASASEPEDGQPLAEVESSDQNSGEDIEDSEPNAYGLGTYGAEGHIERHMLPNGLRKLVTDEAIELANSEEFATARRNWDRPNDFVGQIDYQLTFREHYDFLDVSPGDIAFLLEEKPEHNSSSEGMGLFLSESERVELERRDGLGSKAATVQAAVKHSDVVDIWQDQHHNGKITLAVNGQLHDADRIAVADIIGSENFHVVHTPYSASDFVMFRNKISKRLRHLNLPFKIGTKRSADGYVLKVTLEKSRLKSHKLGHDVPGDAYVITNGVIPLPAGLPQEEHAPEDSQPGLLLVLDRPEGLTYCTWGANGHTGNRNYAVTAGHCLGPTLWDSSGIVGNDLEVWTGTDSLQQFDHLTPRDDLFLRSRLRTTYDAAAFDTPAANTNCFHGTEGDPASDCAWQIENRAAHNSWTPEVHRSCSSLGSSNTYRCGVVLDENVVLDYPPPFDAFSTTRGVEVGFRVIGGDSGAGMKWNNTFDGILICCQESNAVMITAFDVKETMGSTFDYNCAEGFARREPQEWGACPVIDRSP